MAGERRYTIGISIGDVNGIGPEILIKTLSNTRISGYCDIVVYGSAQVLDYHKKALDNHDFHYSKISDVSKKLPKRNNVIQCWTDEAEITLGQETEASGKYAYMALQKATDDLVSGRIDALVTAPINKGAIQKDHADFMGQTEFVTSACGGKESLMLLVSDKLKVGLTTNHIPLKDISEILTKDLILKKLGIFQDSLKKDFLIQTPKIAVLALNPHAGEGGAIGKEENDVIIPAITEAKELGVLAMGPYPADGFFGSGNFRHFDGILAMYHDQGLGPFKAISFGDSVNYTAGLPVIRTSPDHGTGYEIAGKGIASELSFQNAIFMALDTLRKRAAHADMHKNPLRKSALANSEE